MSKQDNFDFVVDQITGPPRPTPPGLVAAQKLYARFFPGSASRCRHPDKVQDAGLTWTGWTCAACGHQHTDFDRPDIYQP